MTAAAEVAPRIVHPAPRITRPLREAPGIAPRIDRPARRAAPPGATHGARALTFVRGLPDHALTDRLVRGRAWIPVLGLLLAGVVAMRVSLMQLSTGMGRAIEQGTSLQTVNGELRAEVAELSNVSRIQRIASNLGMVQTTPGQITFISPRGAGIRAKAIADMSAPSSSALAVAQGASSSTAQGATTTAIAPSTSADGTDSSTAAAPGTTGASVTPTPAESTTGTQSATGTGATTGSTQPADAGTPAGGGEAPTGATGTTGADGTDGTDGTAGAAVPGQQSSGGASSPGVGG
jgi:cell division protein FtsL